MSTAQKIVFTDPYLKSLKAPGIQAGTTKGQPYKRSEWAPKGEGRLLIRVSPTADGHVREFFYRYRTDGSDKTLSLGRYDPDGKSGRTLKQIRSTLRVNRDIQRETGDVKAHKEAEQDQKETESRRGSLGQLLAAYVINLRATGKLCSDEVAGLFRRNVTEPFPQLVKRKASEIEPGDIQRILARMVKLGITRQTNVCRAYLCAAFAYGGKADNDPRTVAKDKDTDIVLFKLKSNPVKMVPVIREYEHTSDRVLEPVVLREYWKALEALPLPQKTTLRFNLALACQRPTQLLRADWKDFDWQLRIEPSPQTPGYDGPVLMLTDGKGKGKPRAHLIPLTDFALEQLAPLRKLNGKESPPFSSDSKTRIDVGTLSNAIQDVCAGLKEAHDIAPFNARDLRRTAETMLQKLGVDKEVRAHLLSHSRTRGAQGKHYERFHFLPEKRAALEKWAMHLDYIINGKSAKVVAIKGAA